MKKKSKEKTKKSHNLSNKLIKNIILVAFKIDV